MSVQVQQLRDTGANLDTFTGLPGLIAVNTDDNTLRVFDGVTVGGFKVAAPPTRAVGISAAGTIQSTATPLTADWNIVATVGANQGVQLRSGSATGSPQWVYNAGANALKVYPATGDGAAINAQATDAAFTVEPNSGVEFRPVSLTQWYSAS